ncbi:MAG: hypothetical protein MI923_30505 [Phycisphaerales bacterium]|nr:hypothetical protein [Phycisphaerales bacterium]
MNRDAGLLIVRGDHGSATGRARAFLFRTANRMDGSLGRTVNWPRILRGRARCFAPVYESITTSMKERMRK